MKKMRHIISNFYRETDLGYLMLNPFYKTYELGLKLVSDKFIIKNSFKKHMGYTIDLDNPLTLNEKINWLKLYERKELHTKVADKYKVRDYIERTIGGEYLIPLLYNTKDPKDIRKKNLPDVEFIIKTNHNSSGGIIVRDKSKVKWKKIRKKLKRLMKENHYYSTREWQYKNIEPRIVVEKLLTYSDGSIPEDFKLHCFNGKLAFVMVDIGRHNEKRYRNIYDKEWNLLPCNWGRPNGNDIEKPSNLKEMIELAEKIAKDFIYVRVDFYSVYGKTYFGELTFHHASGLQKFFQKEWDYKFGKLLNISGINGK
ncbi:ATP-grasp fold amidoligase family protein [uncultured Winogradskyella sp.]|uniref:ATP-grasp fold amidoligase family protein n=1 Tax=uncultured Winogradskyella sp. TaxID=395353 RepID=UPI0026166A92|nr:ATP-grasp fold amidoligase family protein [uncultured Winogradskyella sp.]